MILLNIKKIKHLSKIIPISIMLYLIKLIIKMDYLNKLILLLLYII
jgi:hypothetical protein